jgi:hypothetical protein
MKHESVHLCSITQRTGPIKQHLGYCSGAAKGFAP